MVNYKALHSVYLATGATIILGSFSTTLRIYQGNNLKFSYTLMIFSFLDGVHWVVMSQNYKQNFYITQVSTCIYMLTSLQAWIFSMRYLNSAVNCSLQVSWLTNRTINLTFWIGIFIYSTAILTMNIWLVVRYSEHWNNSQEQSFWRVTQATEDVWSVMTLISTIITAVAIYRICKAIRSIAKDNSMLNWNKKTMLVHIFVLTVQTTSVILYSLPYSWQSQSVWNAMSYVMPMSEVMIQLGVCYICWHMGSNNQLRNQKVSYFINQLGQIRMRFTSMESQIDQGQDECQSEDLEMGDLELSLEHQELQNFNRGISLVNERACDEIMQQFCHGMDEISNESVMLESEEFRPFSISSYDSTESQDKQLRN